MKNRKVSNPVAKNARKFNKATLHTDRKKEMKKKGDTFVDYLRELDFPNNDVMDTNSY